MMQEFLPQAAQISATERLVTTLFFAILVHGIVILGITFSGEEPAPRESGALEITLVNTAGNEIPDQADYLANASQAGEGNTTENVRPESAMSSPDQHALDGVIDADDVENELDAQAGTESPDALAAPDMAMLTEQQVATTADRTRQAQTEANPAISSERTLKLSRLMTPGLDMIEPVNDNSQQPLARSDNPREKFIAVNTRESAYAEYLDRWRRKVEQIGNENYPQAARDVEGDLQIAVALNADGTINELTITRRSAFPVLDEAAIQILRNAGPFPPFSDAMKAETDVLRFEYKWIFGKDRITSRINSDQPDTP